MKRSLLLLAVCGALVCGCAGQARVKWADKLDDAVRTDRPFANDPACFQFAIMSDRHGGGRPGIYEDAVAKLNMLQPEFVMCVGDLISGYTDKQDEIDAQRMELDSMVDKLHMPFFYLPGNHDLSNDIMVKDWLRRYKRTYYHFVYRNVLFLCMDTEDPPSRKFSQEQIQYMAKVLAENKDVRWTFVLMHQPMWDQGEAWAPMEKLLADRQYTVMAGHVHEYSKAVRDGHSYIILATTGGASGLGGPDLGQFDHLVWVTMTPAGPSIVNLMLDGIYDDNVRTKESAQLVSSVYRGFSLTNDAIFLETETFEGGMVPLRIGNASDVPMKFHAVFEPNAFISPEPKQIDLDLPPKSKQEVVVKLNVAGPVKADDVPPVMLIGAASAMLPGLKKPVRIDTQNGFVLDRIRACPRRESGVQVDGKLDEWKALPIACERPAQIQLTAAAWDGPADGSFKFAVEYDDNFVYFAADVVDDKLALDPQNSEPWHRDGIELRLDARPDPERSAGRGEGEFDKILFTALCPGDDPAKTYCVSPDKLPAGVKFACVKTPKGHATEIAIPVKYLDAKQGKPWEAFRLNVQVDDFDGKPDDLSDAAQLCWRPDWRRQLNYAGSGTFRKR